jgi:hypothetical protein
MFPPKIDDETWARLARVAELPPGARVELEQIIVEERFAYPWKKGAAPNEINKELKTLKAHADRLYEGLRKISVGGASAMLSVKPSEEEKDDVAFLKTLKTVFLREPGTDLEPFRLYGETVGGLRDWLGRARATKGTRPLERLIGRLDRFLKRYTDRGGFVRTSQPKRNKSAGGYGHHKFAVTVVGATFGESRYKPSTIDDVIKHIIHRRKLKPKTKRRQSAGLK